MATILYIEDEEDLRNDIAEELIDVGYEVLMAKDGCEGMNMILAHDPDLVISDINMPCKNGRELLVELQEISSELDMPPFLFLTALFDEKDKAEGLKLGAIDYLVKPIELDELISKIAEQLRKNGHSTQKPEKQVA